MNLAEVLLTSGRLLLEAPLLVCLAVGLIWGIICGLLPGVGTAFAIGVVLPLTLGLSPEAAIVMLVAISVGAAFGNSPPAIMLGIAGGGATYLTAIDGYGLTNRGKSGSAMMAAWAGAAVGQLLSVPFFVLLVVPLSTMGFFFLPPEMFALYVFGLVAVAGLLGPDVMKGIVAVAVGVALALVGPDPINAIPRFWVGIPELQNGLPVIPVTLGLVTMAQLLRESRSAGAWTGGGRARISRIDWKDARRLPVPLALGAMFGTAFGAIPGVGATPAAITAHQVSRSISKTPQEFGSHSIEGLAANESAQNAAQAGEMAPTLGLGIPGSDSMVLVLAALTLHGFVPGPALLTESPSLLAATIAALVGGALLILAIGLPMGSGMLRVLALDRRVVIPSGVLATVIGVYALRSSTFDVAVLLAFGVLGLFMLRFEFPPAAAATGFLLGGAVEANLRQGLLLVDSDVLAFFTRPVVVGILAAAAGLLVLSVRGIIGRGQRPRNQTDLGRRS